MSNKTGKMMCGRNPDIKLGLDEPGHLPFPRWEPIDSIDYVARKERTEYSQVAVENHVGSGLRRQET